MGAGRPAAERRRLGVSRYVFKGLKIAGLALLIYGLPSSPQRFVALAEEQAAYIEGEGG